MKKEGMTRSRSKIFLLCCLAFIAGVFAASFLSPVIVSYRILWFAIAIVCTVAVFFCRLFLSQAKYYDYLLLAGLAGMMIFFGVWRYSLTLPADTPDKIWHYNGQNVKLNGKVAKEPEESNTGIKYVLSVNSVQNVSAPVTGEVLIFGDPYPAYDFGDNLMVSCKLKKPMAYESFAYDRYLARQRIFSLCYQPKINELPARLGAGERLFLVILEFKRRLADAIDAGLAEPEAGLARGMTLGENQALPSDLAAQFSQTGLSHIIAISGMNMTIIVALLSQLFLSSGLRRQQAFYLITMILVGYIILIGAPVSAIRAAVMAWLFLWAMQLGRLSRLTNALVATAAFMLLFNPKLLRDDLGFQLSFMALCGLIYLYPLIVKLFDNLKIPSLKGARDLVALTLAAQLATLPLLLGSFAGVSLVAPLSNLLVLWCLPLLTILIFIGIFLTCLLPTLTTISFFPTQLLLAYIIKIVEITANLPWAYLKIGQWGWLFTLSYYGLGCWIVIKYKNVSAENKFLFFGQSC